MTWQQYREIWVKYNTCKFCVGNHMHTCDLYQCEYAVKEAEEYFDRVIEQEEIRRMKRKYVTDLRPWFAENMKVGNVLEEAWLISDEEKKEIIVKFKDIMSKIERAMALKLIGKRYIERVQRVGEDKGSFEKLMDGAQLREWRKTDGETIRNGIPHGLK